MWGGDASVLSARRRMVEAWPCDPVTSQGKAVNGNLATRYYLLRRGYVVWLTGTGESRADCSSSKYEEKRTCKTASALFEGNNIPTHRRRSVSPYCHLDVRRQPATGSASTSLASPACRMDFASALRSRS